MKSKRSSPRAKLRPVPPPSLPVATAVADGRVTMGLAAVVFGVQFALYVAALAPTVTFEDSGELITAAYSLGVPHEPGYPLFTMLGKLFSLAPVGTVAYRVNLLSACFSAAGCVFVFLIALELAHQVRLGSGSRWIPAVLAWCGSLAVGLGPSYMSQAVITEVYGLNVFFAGLLLWLALRWVRYSEPTAARQPVRQTWIYYAYCLGAGLALTNHHTALIYLPLGFLFALMVDRAFILNPRRILSGVTLIGVGLLPYLYLPLASSSAPAMDWGDPENWTNFWQVVTRHQYGLDAATARSVKTLAAQVGLHYQLLFEEFSYVFLAAGLIGLGVLFFRKRRLFYFSLLFNFFTGPLVAYVTNVNPVTRDPFAAAEQKGLVSVMYLPFYLYWGALAVVGLLAVVERVMQKPRRTVWASVLVGGAVAATTWFGYPHYRSQSMAQHTFAEEYFHNLETTLEPDALVIVNWDPFAFPPMYFQHVEGRALKMAFLDVELLRRSWYIRMLRQWYPEVMARSAREVDQFLDAVRPFENSQPYDPNFIQSRYLAMVNSFADRNVEQRPIYLTIYEPIRNLEPGMFDHYIRQSCLVAQRLVRAPGPLPAVDDHRLTLANLINPAVPKDRMANMLRNYYAARFADRAFSLEPTDLRESRRLYGQALSLVESPVIQNSIRQRYDLVSSRLP